MADNIDFDILSPTGGVTDGPSSFSLDSSGGSGFNPLSLGALGVGAAGFGAILGKGESPLPPEFSALTGSVPGLMNEASLLEQQGATLAAGGTATLDAASKGILTPEQQAQLGQYGTGLTNQARQQFYSMGRNPDQDTAFISQTADIDAKVNAMAQQQIQSSIALGLGQLSAGANFSGQGLGFTNAANQALIQAGNAQIAQDKSYSDSLSAAFSSIGKMFAQAGPSLAMLAL